MLARYAERAAADRRRGRGGRAARRALPLGARVVVEPAADRRSCSSSRARRALRGDGLVRGGRARQAGAGRLPRGRSAARRRARALRGGRGLRERHPRRACGGHARDRDPEPRATRRRPTRSRSPTSCSVTRASSSTAIRSLSDGGLTGPRLRQSTRPRRTQRVVAAEAHRVRERHVDLRRRRASFGT